MCVAAPGRIEWIGAPTAASIPGRIDAGGRLHDVDLIMVPEAALGDYVIAHSGFAIRLVPGGEAEETRRLLGLED